MFLHFIQFVVFLINYVKQFARTWHEVMSCWIMVHNETAILLTYTLDFEWERHTYEIGMGR